MSAADGASLAKQRVATFSGLSASASVALSASATSPWEDWRSANFNSTELAAPLISRPDADKHHEGIVNLLATIPAGNAGKRFVRLRVPRPSIPSPSVPDKPRVQAHGYRDLTEECPGNEVRGCAAIAIEEISSEFENGWSDLCRNPLHLE